VSLKKVDYEKSKSMSYSRRGNGTRIRSASAELPKPLVDFRGKPFSNT